MNKEIPINRECVCIRGSKSNGNWTRGKTYLVHALYQDNSGDFMVGVATNWGDTERVEAYANRFNVLQP